MNERKVINSPAPGSKKAEGRKRKPPFTPYREKAKGKEQSRVSNETSYSKPARAYARRRPPCTCSYNEAGAAADEIVGSWSEQTINKLKVVFRTCLREAGYIQGIGSEVLLPVYLPEEFIQDLKDAGLSLWLPAFNVLD